MSDSHTKTRKSPPVGAMEQVLETAKPVTPLQLALDAHDKQVAQQKSVLDAADKLRSPQALNLAEMTRNSQRPSALAEAVQPLDRKALARLAEFKTSSDKIRALAAASMPRAEIARTLGLRYQHVRNVLVADEAKREASKSLEDHTDELGASPRVGGLLRGKVGPAGRVVIPAQIRDVLGLEEGMELVFTVEGDEIRVTTMPTHLRRLQARMRELIPQAVSVVDEFIADRRAEQAAEDEK